MSLERQAELNKRILRDETCKNCTYFYGRYNTSWRAKTQNKPPHLTCALWREVVSFSRNRVHIRRPDRSGQ